MNVFAWANSLRLLERFESLNEGLKLFVVNVIGLVAILGLYFMAIWFSPKGDPTILGWLICKKMIVAIIGILAMVDAFVTMDLVTHGSWWVAIHDEKNMAVAVACAGLFIGLGFIISGTV